MFPRLSATRPDPAALQRVETLARARFGLGADDLVLVREEPGRQRDEPATMTTVLFWRQGMRHRLRLFKPAVAVTGADLPPGWVAGALRDEGDADCC